MNTYKVTFALGTTGRYTANVTASTLHEAVAIATERAASKRLRDAVLFSAVLTTTDKKI